MRATGRVWGDGMTAKVLWDVVRTVAAKAGIERLAPHDLRRTCARLCHLAYVDAHNDRGAPFRWIKTADEILDSMRRFGVRGQQVHGQ